MVLDDLEAAVDALVIAVDADEVARVMAIKGRLEAKVNAALTELDATKLWDADGSSSLAAWLRNHGCSRRDAGRYSAMARQLAKLPVLRAAWESGAISSGQVDAILAVVTTRLMGLFAEHEADLVPTLVGLTVTDTSDVINEWRRRADAFLDSRSDGDARTDGDGDGDGDDGEPAATLYASPVGGRCAIDGDLDGRIGELFRTALRVAETRDPEGHRRPPAVRRADALATISQFFLDNHAARTAGSNRNRPHVSVICDLTDLEQRRGGRYVNGAWVDQPTMDTWLCDSVLRRLLFADGVTLDYGTSVRTAPAPLFNALVDRDQHCRFSGCDRPPHWCEAHHNREWRRHNGPTRLANLVLLCSYHHHLLHRRGWAWQLEPDGTFHVTDPLGRTQTTHPPRVVAERARTLFDNLAHAYAT